MAPPPGENQAAPQPRQNIAKDGDLILVVGPKRVEIRVDSHILRAASKTFRAMFGPHFAEGQNLGGNNVKYVDLPEDSASGMTQVCRLLHFCCDITQPGPEPDVLLEAARVVDKYFLQKSVSFAVDRWLKPDTEIYDPSELISGLGKMAIAADLFDHSQGFYRVTRAMLLSCGWGRSDYEYFPDSADAECRWRMIYCLHKARQQHINDVKQLLQSVSTQCLDSACTCGWRSRWIAAYWDLLEKNDLTFSKIDGQSLEDTLILIAGLPEPKPRDRSLDCTFVSEHQSPSYKSNLRLRMGNLERSTGGLCLHCFRVGQVHCPDHVDGVC